MHHLNPIIYITNFTEIKSTLIQHHNNTTFLEFSICIIVNP